MISEGEKLSPDTSKLGVANTYKYNCLRHISNYLPIVYISGRNLLPLSTGHLQNFLIVRRAAEDLRTTQKDV